MELLEVLYRALRFQTDILQLVKALMSFEIGGGVLDISLVVDRSGCDLLDPGPLARSMFPPIP